MEFGTERLKISYVSSKDIEAVHQLHSLPETDRYNTLGIPGSIEETKLLVQEWINVMVEVPIKKYIFCIHTTGGEFVGIAGIQTGREKFKNAEIWYKLHPGQWNKGYATELVKGLQAFGFKELGLHRLEAGCAVQNIASKRVLEKCGFQQEGIKRKNLPIRGEWVSACFFAILDEDYKQITI